ncbi:transposase [Opitutaceae bacterium TAV1]|nr:transposase [Opitutaceae bacterium TAV1]EIQ00334.1 transposase [Opitutaceae bacterium TAV1]
MKALTISDREKIIMSLHAEIRCDEAARYHHRLHALLLVAQGMTCPQVAGLLGDSPRAVVKWVRQFEAGGLAGLTEGWRPGRPGRIGPAALARVRSVLRENPARAGVPVGRWSGRTLAAFLREKFGVRLSVRQCQRLLKEHGRLAENG